MKEGGTQMALRFLLPVLFLVSFTTNVRADEDGSYTNYDAIVNELRESASTEPKPVHEAVNWDEVAWHGGLSLAGSLMTFRGPGVNGSGFLKGFEAHIGANLFSKVARGELAFRNFAPENISGSNTAEMRELEGRVIFLPVLADKTLLRMGGGLSERTSSFGTPSGKFSDSEAYYTLLVGFERKVAPAVSIGPDVSYHAPMTQGTYAATSWDTTLTLNASF
jgi:hypothetical protein